MKYIDQLRANVVSQLSKQGINQTVAACSLGLRQNSLSARLYGKTQFRLDELLALATLFEISLHDLLECVEEEYRSNETIQGVAS